MTLRAGARLVCALLCAAAVGCAPASFQTRKPPDAPHPLPAPPTPPPPRPASNLAREQNANRLVEAGDLWRARLELEILAALEPENTDHPRRLAKVTALIRDQVEHHLVVGRQALERGDHPVAELELLRALALDPKDPRPLGLLRDMERHEMLRIQAAKRRRIQARRARSATASGKPATTPVGASSQGNGQEKDYLETGIELFKAGDYEASILEIRKYLAVNPADAQAKGYVERARKRIAGEAMSVPPAGTSTSRKPAPAHPDSPVPAASAQTGPPPRAAEVAPAGADRDPQRAQDLYEDGLRIYRKDIDRAIELWEAALTHDPDHVQTKLHLDRAIKMRERLRRIGGN